MVRSMESGEQKESAASNGAYRGRELDIRSIGAALPPVVDHFHEAPTRFDSHDSW